MFDIRYCWSLNKDLTVCFVTFCDDYILDHLILLIVATNDKFSSISRGFVLQNTQSKL